MREPSREQIYEETWRALQKAREEDDAIEVGRQLARVRARRLYALRHSSFAKFVRAAGCDPRAADRALRLYQVAGAVRAGRLGREKTESLSWLPEEELIRFLGRRHAALDKFGNPVERTLEELKPEELRRLVDERLCESGDGLPPKDTVELCDTLDAVLASAYASVEPGRVRVENGVPVPTIDVRGVDVVDLKAALERLLAAFPPSTRRPPRRRAARPAAGPAKKKTAPARPPAAKRSRTKKSARRTAKRRVG